MISDLGVVWIQLYSLQSIFFKQIKIKRRYLLPVRDTNSAIFKDDLVKTKYLFLFYSELPFWTIRMLCLLVLSCVLHVAFAQALLEDLPDSEQSILTFKLLCTWHYKVSSSKRCLIEIALYSVRWKLLAFLLRSLVAAHNNHSELMAWFSLVKSPVPLCWRRYPLDPSCCQAHSYPTPAEPSNCL